MLLLALALTVYGAVALTEVPKWGQDAEHAWDDDMQAALVTLAAASTAGVGQASPVSTSVPMGSEPQSVDIPILGALRPLPPSGSVSFKPSCGGVDATHTTGDGTTATTIADLAELPNAPQGCLLVEAETAYAPAFSYALELGGLVRVQGDRAVVVAGPPLELDAATSRVGLSLWTLRGSALAASSPTGVRIDLVPGGASLDEPSAPNAASVAWDLHTEHASAWRSWFAQAFTSAGFATSTYSVTCSANDCATGIVEVRIVGPDSDAETNDISLALAHGVYDVALR